MVQFSKSTRPLQPRSYARAVKGMERLQGLILRYSAATEPRDRAQLTRAIHGLSYAAQELSRRHRQVSLTEDMREKETP